MRTVLSLWKGEIIIGRPIMAEIASEIAHKHGLTLADLKSQHRARRYVTARWEAMSACYATGVWSMPCIGRFFGGRDHSSVWHGVHKHDARALAPREAA